MATINVDSTGETCPIPLVEARKALRRAERGDIVEIRGTHPASKKEIPMPHQRSFPTLFIMLPRVISQSS